MTQSLDIIRYKPFKLLMLSAVCAVSFLLFIAIFTNPEGFSHYQGRGGRLLVNLAGPTGRYVATLPLALLMLTGGFLFGFRAVGSEIAIKMGSAGIEVASLFKRHKLQWSDLKDVTVQELRLRGNEETYLNFWVAGNGWSEKKKIRVTVGITDLDKEQIPEFLDRLMAHKNNLASPVNATRIKPEVSMQRSRVMGFGRKQA